MNVSNPTTASSRGPNHHDEHLDLSRFLSALWAARKWIASAAFVSALIAAVYVQFYVSPVYQATSSIKLEMNKASVIDLKSVAMGFSGDTMELNTEQEVLRSRSLMRAVVIDQNLLDDPEFNYSLKPPSKIAQIKAKFLPSQKPEKNQDNAAAAEAEMQNVIDALLKKTSAFNLPQTYVFQVSATSQNPQKAVRLADAIAAQYINNQIAKKFEDTDIASRWLSERVAELGAELETAEAALAQFSASADVQSAENLAVLERQLKELRERKSEFLVTIGTRERSLTQLRESLKQTREEQAKQANIERISLMLERGELENFDAAIAALVSKNERELAVMQKRAQAIEVGIGGLEAEISQQNSQLIQINQLTRETEANRLLYEHFLSRLKETSAQKGLQQADSDLLSQAVMPHGPASPKKKRTVIVAAVLGAIFASLIALTRAAIKSSISSIEEVETQTGLPIWGRIPTMHGKTPHAVLSALSKDPKSPASEAIRHIRTSVLFTHQSAGTQVVLVTSGLPSEGKTTLSVALAQQLADLGKRTLLIDGDLRRRGTHTLIGSGAPVSLSDISDGTLPLTGAISRRPDLGVDILSFSDGTKSMADALSSSKLSSLLATAREEYDVIVIDTPPVLLVPDSRILFQHADTSILVVRLNQTTRAQIDDTLDLLQSDGRGVSGIVINGLREGEAGNYYGQKYSYSY